LGGARTLVILMVVFRQKSNLVPSGCLEERKEVIIKKTGPRTSDKKPEKLKKGRNTNLFQKEKSSKGK